MTDDELRAALLGLYTYDTGGPGGIYDEALRARARAALAELVARDRAHYQLVSHAFDRFIRDTFLTEEKIEQGFGLEDLMAFLRWLESDMGGPQW